MADDATATKEMLSFTCSGCHGPRGVSMGPSIPSISGQSKNYLLSVMLAYKYHDNQEELDKIMMRPAFEDFTIYPRYSVIMSRLMTGYTIEELTLIAEYFSEQKWQHAKQNSDSSLASTGKKIHKNNCGKCHENGGTSNENDTALLAGQWIPYLTDVMDDYHNKQSKMPNKMEKKLKKTYEEYGGKGIATLIQYYGNQ